jgi:hypothetical protein
MVSVVVGFDGLVEIPFSMGFKSNRRGGDDFYIPTRPADLLRACRAGFSYIMVLISSMATAEDGFEDLGAGDDAGHEVEADQLGLRAFFDDAG